MTTANECLGPGTLTANEILSEASEKRVKNATEELQKYIEKFTNVEQTKPTATPISCCYGSSNGSLLSTKPESISTAKKHSRKVRTSTEKHWRMADNLVQWVNESYSKDLQRKIVPFGQRSISSVDTNGLSQTEGNSGANDDDDVSTLADGDVQVSTLPSLGTSVVSDLDSNVGSVNTDVLLNSFYQHEKKMNHPSWVEELVTTKHYPSWIDDMDESHAGHQNVSHHHRNRLSRSLSPSFFRELSFPNSTSFQSTSLQDQPKKISDPKRKKSKAWDLESTDTEALISESIYGSQPVNMGGTFHQSLYRDKTIQQLHDSSVKKIARDFERSLIKEMSFAHVEDSIRSENQPAQHSTKPRKTTNPKTPVNKQHKKTNGQLMEAPKSLPHARRPQNISADHLEPQNFSKNVNPNTSKPLSLNLGKADVRKNSTGSSNTDRLMRQSPTGIKMEKQNTRSKTIENSTRNARRTDHIQDRSSTHIDNTQFTPTPSVQRQDFHTRSNYRASQRDSPNVRYTSQNVHTSRSSPRRNASEELQRIIDEAEANEGQKKDHYLSGKVSKKNLPVQDRKRIFNNDRINSWKGSNTKRTGLNYSTNGNLNGNYLPRKDLRTFSSRGLPSPDRYHGRISENGDSGPYEERSPRRKFACNSDPTKLGVTGTTSSHNFRSRSRTKSAPGMKAGLHTRMILPEREGRYREGRTTQSRVTKRDMKHPDKKNVFAVNYANADYANEQKVLQDELESIDTEALVIKPPMPLFDASPSLTTESVESTLGSQEDGDTLIENLALRTSFLATELHSSSGTSYLEFKMSPPNHEIGQNWEDENISQARLAAKPGIITSFLDDCIRSSEESRSDIHVNHGMLPRSFIENEEESVMSEETSTERPVETLKKMLFAVQRLAYSSEEDQGENDQFLETQSEILTEGVLSDILSTASHNEGQDSLSRAYYHLARLKRLVSASKEVAAWK